MKTNQRTKTTNRDEDDANRSIFSPFPDLAVPTFSKTTPFADISFNVLFDEPVNATTARNTNNYTLTRLGTADTVGILSILYSSALGVLLNVDPTDPNWTPNGDYVLTVNRVTDTHGNVIAPDSQIAVSWLRTTNLVFHPWRFYNSWIFDPDPPINTNWYACDFVESFLWADGNGCFYFGLSEFTSCLGGISPPNPTGYQPEPVLLRTYFYWPTNLPTSNVTLRPRFEVDDGAVFYLNGIEIARYNMPAGPVDSTTKAVTIIAGPPVCATNVSWSDANLVSGTNCFAVAVYQAANATDADVFFCFETDARYLVTPILSPEPRPALAATRLAADRLRLSWTGGGYALESATNLSLGSASYPLGPWQQVPNMSNPYTNNLSGPARFFRLKK